MRVRIFLSLAVFATVVFLSGLAQAGPFICNGGFHAAPDHSGDAGVPGFILKISTGSVAAGAESFVGSMGKRALGFLSNESLGKDQKREEFRKLLNDSYDMDTIGRFALGRYWRTSTPEQRSEYLKLFRKMVVDVYTERFSEYKGQRLETRGSRVDGEKDTIVSTAIVSGDSSPDIQVDWRVRYKNGKYKIVDVIVEGVSMSVTQRSDFAAVIQRGGGDVQVLLAHLRSQ